ncbi:unnamed protein product [Lathyrus oleraceus]
MDSMPLLVLRAVAAEGKQDAPPVEAASVAELVGGAIVAAAMAMEARNPGPTYANRLSSLLYQEQKFDQCLLCQ